LNSDHIPQSISTFTHKGCKYKLKIIYRQRKKEQTGIAINIVAVLQSLHHVHRQTIMGVATGGVYRHGQVTSCTPYMLHDFLYIKITIVYAGVVLEGFLRFPETTQDFPSTMGVPLFGYNFSRGIHSRLNSGVTGFCFELKLRKCSENLFLVTTKENWRPSQKFVLQRYWKPCAKIPAYTSATNRLFGSYSAKSLEPPLCVCYFYT